MSDLISREEAIRIAEQGQVQGYEWQFKKLVLLPSAQKTGKLIDSGYGVECSLCGEWYPHASIARNQLNFCPNCGARMVDKDE